MKNKTAIGLLMLSLILIMMACSGTADSKAGSIPNTVNVPASAPAPAVTQTPVASPSQKPSGPIKEKWINATVSGDTVSVSTNDIKSNWNTAFKMVNNGTTLNFMAYVLNGEIQVRANVCPPCRSIGYSLDNNVLVCDMCATTFKATDGSGIQGACVKFPKATVTYKIVNDNLVMNVNELVDAYQRTLSGKG